MSLTGYEIFVENEYLSQRIVLNPRAQSEKVRIIVLISRFTFRYNHLYWCVFPPNN